MKGKKKIVFIPGTYYLCHPSYFRIALDLRDKYDIIYLNTNDPLQLSTTNKQNIKEKEILQYFTKYEKIPSRPITHSKIPKLLKIFFLWEWYKLKKDIEKKILSLQPEAIICNTDIGGFSLKTANLLAQKKKIPFIVMQTYLVEYKPPKHLLKQKVYYLLFNKILGLPFERRQQIEGREYKDNYFLVWSNFFNKTINKKNTFIIGNYHLDYNTTGNREGTITICTQPIEEIYGEDFKKNITKMFLEAATILKEEKFIIKVHPRENMEYYTSLFRNQKNCLVTKDMTLKELIKTTKTMITVDSNITLDFIVGKIPTIQTKTPFNDFCDYYKTIIKNRVKNTQELVRRIKQLNNEEEYKQFLKQRELFLKKFIGEKPEKDHVISTIDKIIKKNSSKQ